MDVFSPTPPDWASGAINAKGFCCPRCGAVAAAAAAAWINRRAPVYTPDHRRKWQEFYRCGDCLTPWWAWSSDRPPTPEVGDSSGVGDDASPADPLS